MNIFDQLKSFKSKYELKERRIFSKEEKDSVASATVKPSTYGFSVCFIMKSGVTKYIPVSRDTVTHEGQNVDLSRAELLTLVKDNDNTIFRIEF